MLISDYLLKPISFERFVRAVSKVFPHISVQEVQPVTDSHNQESKAFVYLKSEKKMVKVFLSDIIYIESLASYTQVFTADKKIICYKKISEFEEKLPQGQFLRVHRSFLISLSHVEAYTSSNIEIGGIQVPIGRNYKQEVLNVMQNQQSLDL